MTFPGSNQYLNFGSIAIALGSVGLSIKMKLAWTSYNNWARVIDFNNGASGVQDMFITLPGTSNILRFQYKENGSEQQCDCSSNSISLNTVYNIAVVYDPTIGTDKTYANTYIGKSSYGGDAYLAAQVYQLDIYPYPISSTLASTLL